MSLQSAPPENGAYMVAAYVLTAVILLAYTALLWRRVRAWRRDEREGK